MLAVGVLSACARAQRGESAARQRQKSYLRWPTSRGRRQGLQRLEWDPRTARQAALKHCHADGCGGPRFRTGITGELDLTERRGTAGAHFSLIEENIAVGSYPAKIHEAWMESTGHERNLLNPEVDRIGVAVVSAQGGCMP